MAKKKPENYIDNKTFYKYLIDYQESCRVAKEAGKERPQITREIGDCFRQIANRLATKPNFARYPFRDEMINDGIENACDAVLKFKPSKSQNPFAYFTQIIWNALIRRIEREKKQLLAKKKYYDHLYTNSETADTALMRKYSAVPHFTGTYMQNDYMDDLHEKHEKKMSDQKK